MEKPEPLTELTNTQSQKIKSLQRYKELCQLRIRDLQPSHPLPVKEDHIGQTHSKQSQQIQFLKQKIRKLQVQLQRKQGSSDYRQKTALQQSLRAEILQNQQQKMYIEILKQALQSQFSELGWKGSIDQFAQFKLNMKEVQQVRRDQGRFQNILKDQKSKISNLSTKNKELNFKLRKTRQNRDQALKSLKEAAQALDLAQQEVKRLQEEKSGLIEYINDMTETENKLKEDLEIIAQGYEKITLEKNRAEEEIQELKKGVKLLEKRLEVSGNNLSRLEGQKQKLDQYIASIQKKLEAQENNSSILKQKLNYSNIKIENFQSNIKSLTTSLSQTQIQHERILNNHNRLEESNLKLKELLEKTIQESSENKQDLEQALKQKKEDLMNLNQSNQNLNVKITLAQTEKKNMQRQITQAQNFIQQAQLTEQNLKQTIRKLKNDQSNLKEQNAILQDQKSQLQSQNKRIQNTVNSLQKQIFSIQQQKFVQKLSFNRSQSELQEINQNQTQKLKSFETNQKYLQQKLISSQHKCSQLKQQLQNVHQTLTQQNSLKSQLQSQISLLQSKLSSSQSSLSKTISSLTKSQNCLLQTQSVFQATLTELDSKSRQVQTLRQQNRQLQIEFNRNNSYIAKQKAHNQDLLNHIKSSKQAIQNFALCYPQLTVNLAQQKSLSAYLESLQNQVLRVSKLLDQTTETLRNTRCKNHQLQLELSLIHKESISIKERDQNRLNKISIDSKTYRDVSNKRINALQNELMSQRNSQKGLEDENSYLTHRVSEAFNQVDRLSALCEEYKFAVRVLQEKSRRLQQEKKSLQIQIFKPTNMYQQIV